MFKETLIDFGSGKPSSLQPNIILRPRKTTHQRTVQQESLRYAALFHRTQRSHRWEGKPNKQIIWTDGDEKDSGSGWANKKDKNRYREMRFLHQINRKPSSQFRNLAAYCLHPVYARLLKSFSLVLRTSRTAKASLTATKALPLWFETWLN